MKKMLVSAVFVALLNASPGYASGIPVFDAASLSQDAMQFAQTLMNMIEQLTTAKEQLTQQVKQFESLTGGRGMENLLSGQVRNYIPSEWQDALNLLDNPSSSYSSIANRAQRIVEENKVLSDDKLNSLSSSKRQIIEKRRNTLATHKALIETTYSTASQRFNTLQSLTSSISAATDPKAIMDLQARIQSEQVQLQNENIKLQAMSQAMQLELMIQAQMEREDYANAQTYLKDR
ncbi:MAG: type IV secretion system protein [Deltaproteobacteria bacterium]|jgi:type IV secretion system protein VirB5|nr:type IV secretion system protein [Deltaproteobacteria bacterium]